MSISQMLLSFPPHFPFSFRTSTEPGRVMHWHHWSWVLDQTPKLAYSPLTYYSPASPSTTLTWLLLRCFLWALLPRNFLFPFIFKTTTTKALFLAVSFCSRGWRMLSHIASGTAACCNSVFCLKVRSGHPTEKLKRLAVPLRGSWGSIFLAPARPCCVYWEALAKLLCLGDHSCEQNLIVFVLILCLTATFFFLCQVFSVGNHCSFFCFCFLPDFPDYSYNYLLEWIFYYTGIMD